MRRWPVRFLFVMALNPPSEMRDPPTVDLVAGCEDIAELERMIAEGEQAAD